MKWVILTGFLVLLGHGEGNVLRCIPNGEDASCATEEEKALPPSIEVVDEAPRVECLAGSEWESNCHYCRCSDAGTAECLKTACEGPFLSKNPEQPRPQGKECAIGSTWKNRCSTCVCEAPGYPVCNQTECRGSENEPENGRCAPYSTWKNDCNSCWCSPAGYGQCTLIGCLHEKDLEIIEQKTEEESIAEPLLSLKTAANQTCKAKAMFIKDCNICWCNEFGTDFFCTRKVCVPDLPDEPPVETPEVSLSRKVRATPQESPKACQPGQEFRLDCNKCLCDNEGLAFSCTRIDCVAAQNGANARTKRETGTDLIEIETTCTAGGVFQAECNTCRCSADGRRASCTHEHCTPNHLDSALHDAEPDPGFRCNPGEQFKRDCNDCTCSADGRSTFCTLRLCDEMLPQSISP